MLLLQSGLVGIFAQTWLAEHRSTSRHVHLQVVGTSTQTTPDAKAEGVRLLVRFDLLAAVEGV